MSDPVLLRQIVLCFDENAAVVRADISAVAVSPEGHLWIGSDELTTIERLSPLANGGYGEHQQYAVGDYVDLQDTDSEIDIEGMDFSEGYLWLVGSHSSKRKTVKGRDASEDIQRLLEIGRDRNRYLLARLPIEGGRPVKQVGDKTNRRTAAALKQKVGMSSLTEALVKDEHLGIFVQMGLPSKENGFDIEAIAAKGQRLFVGLRGPVIGGMAIVLEIEVEEKKTGILKLKKLENNRLYRKHFLDLNGLGIRDLCFQDVDLIILAGPTMRTRSAMQVFRFESALAHAQDTVWRQKEASEISGGLTKLFDLPLASDGDNAEGVTLLPNEPVMEEGHSAALMVVYDSPSVDRLKNEGSILADVYQLPH